MTISTKSAKDKGRRLQKYVRDKLLTMYHKLTPDDVRSTPMGVNGEDVQLSPLAREYFPYSVECKAKNKHTVYRLYEQAVTNGKVYEPLLVIREDRKDALVVLNADYFFRQELELQRLRGKL